MANKPTSNSKSANNDPQGNFMAMEENVKRFMSSGFILFVPPISAQNLQLVIRYLYCQPLKTTTTIDKNTHPQTAYAVLTA